MKESCLHIEKTNAQPFLRGAKKVFCGARRPGREPDPGKGSLRGQGGLRTQAQAQNTRAVFVQLALRWGRNRGAQWHLARAVGKRFWGCRAKRLYVYCTPGSDEHGPRF